MSSSSPGCPKYRPKRINGAATGEPLEGQAQASGQGHRAGAGTRPAVIFGRGRPAGDYRPRLSLAREQLTMALIDPNAEWIGNVQPVGLVVAPAVLARLGLNPAEQTRADSEAVRAVLSRDD